MLQSVGLAANFGHHSLARPNDVLIFSMIDGLLVMLWRGVRGAVVGGDVVDGVCVMLWRGVRGDVERCAW